MKNTKIQLILILTVMLVFSLLDIPVLAANGNSPDITAVPVEYTLSVNGNEMSLWGYKINDGVYFKLCDIAMALNRTDRQFEVSWIVYDDYKEVNLSSGTAYTPVGRELSSLSNKGKALAQPATTRWYVDGRWAAILAYTINENHYVKLSDLAGTLKFASSCDMKKHTVEIDTSEEYSNMEVQISYSEDKWLSDEPVTGVKSYLSADLDGDGQNETAEIAVSQAGVKKWTLVYKNGASENSIQIFKGNENGFVTSIAAGHILSEESIDFLVSANHMSMPFGGWGYELYSFKNGVFTKIDVSGVTDGTEFDVSVNENEKTAKLSSNGFEKTVKLSKINLSDYKLYGKEFCQDFFVDMEFKSTKDGTLHELVTTEVIAADLPNALTYLHTTYRYINGVWNAVKVEFYDFEAVSRDQGNTGSIDNIALINAGNSYSTDEDGNVVLCYKNGETISKAPIVLQSDGSDYDLGQSVDEAGFYISKEKTAIAYGGIYGDAVYVLTSNDMGKTWEKSEIIARGVGTSQMYIGFITPDDGWLVLCSFHGMGHEDNFIYRTADGGKTWEQIGNPNDLYARMVTGAGFVNDRIGFLCFRFEFADFSPAICRTLDGGQTWEKLYMDLPEKFEQYYSKTPLSPVFNGADGVLPIELKNADGDCVTIYLTSTDYGKTWTYDEAYKLTRI